MKRPYLPKDDKGKADWLDNFALKLPTYVVILGITPAELASVQADAVMFNYILDAQESFKTFKQDLSNYKNLLRDGGPGPTGPFPTAPVLPPAPPAVQKGIFRRIRQLVANIKSTPSYTEAMGEDLGIVGDEQTIDIPNLKPELKSRLDVGRPLIIWSKGPAESIDIYVDRKDGSGFVFLANDTHPDYLDTFELPAGQNSAIWDYRAVYRMDDVQVGQFSDTIHVTVSRLPGA
ncbi:MAG: hypothetical protein AB1599_07320 [Planctomycetota bacterium]